MELNEITEEIIGSAITVHRALGPGLIESAYEVCLAHEMHKQGLHVQTQVALPVLYDNIKLDAGYRLDLLVEQRIIIELKAVERLIPIHEAQLLSYLKLSKLPLGLLINFNVKLLRDGIRRLAN
jgi:GxxExxY protein